MFKLNKNLIAAAGAGFALLIASAVDAADGIPADVDPAKIAEANAKIEDGWHYGLKIGATGSFTHSHNVVGATNGATVPLGILLEGKLQLLAGQHGWENALKIQEAQTLTPQLASFIKSADELDLKSTYTYAFESLSWLGPYGRLALNTQLLRGYDVRTEDAIIIRSRNDATAVTKLKASRTRIATTRAFEPLTLRQSVGMFANPLAEKVFTLKTKAGFGLQEIITQDGFTLTDDAATPEIEYTQLNDATQGGVELEVEANGTIIENVTWTARAAFFMPFFTTAATDLDGIELLNTELAAKLSVKIATWLSLDYVLSAKRIPLILDDWQVQNGILATAGFDLL